MNITPHLILSHFLGIGPVRFQTLLKHFNTPENIIKANEKELSPIIGQHLSSKFIQFRNIFKPDSIISQMNKKNIRVLCYGMQEYPKLLCNIPDPPICLYVIGDNTILNDQTWLPLAVVGSRRMTSYGKQVIEKLVPDLCFSRTIIISGLALGIDSEAHIQTLKHKGKTIAVLGCGVDVPHPPSNFRLYQQIIESGGCIVSEFPPGHRVKRGLFVARNRIISGLSKGVLVIEGTKDSGSLITARYAAEQSRDVFAVPGPINSPFSEAPNSLIKNGAVPVTSALDIFDYYKITTVSSDQKRTLESLQDSEKKLYDELSIEPQTADELCRKTHLPIAKVLTILSSLQLKGVISQNSEGAYYKK